MVSRQLMSRWTTLGSIAALVGVGSLICWLYVAEVSKNLEPTKAGAPAGTARPSALPQTDRADANQARTETASAIAPLRQGLQDQVVDLEQVKQALQQQQDRTDQETRRLAADLAQTQQLMQRGSEQARQLAADLTTTLAKDLTTDIEQMRRTLQQQGDRVEKLALEPHARDEPDDRLRTLSSDLAQVRQAMGALAVDLHAVRQALSQESENNDRKVAQLATDLREVEQSAQRERQGAERRGRELAGDLAYLKNVLQRETDRNENDAHQTSAAVAQIKDALNQEIEQRIRAADELTAGLAQLRLTLHQLTADLAARQAEVNQSGVPRGRNSEQDAGLVTAQLTVARQPQNPGTPEEPETAPGPEADLPSRGSDLSLTRRSEGMAGSGADSPARLHDNPKSLPTPRVDLEQSAQPSIDADDMELKRLMSRANVLIRQGDIGAARIVLERAAETGNAQALFALAETFDPVVLSTWGTLGTLGDAARARELYAKALAGGLEEARSRLAR
jgi:hypothetical protein